jgi:peptidoglycan/LPS O-acetylase OafA/YrhL
MKERLLALDALRAIAAILIVIGHSDGILTLPGYLFWIRNSFFYGVQLFLIIAGFSLSYAYYEHLRTQAEVRDYFIHRFFRIAPLFYVLLLIYGVYLYFTNNVSFTLNAYLLNFTFLFNLFPGIQEGILPAGWFMSLIFLFYLVFPILIIFIRKARIALVVFIGSLLISSYYFIYIASFGDVFILYSYESVITQLPFFLLGILCYLALRNFLFKQGFLEKRSIKALGGALIGIGVVLYGLISLRTPIYSFLFTLSPMTANLYIWLLIYGCILIGFILFPWKGIVNRISQFIGVRSYSIYLIHPGFLLIYYEIYVALFPLINNFDLTFLISIVIILTFVMAVSVITYRFIEQPALKYGISLLQKLKERSSHINKLEKSEILQH